MNPSFENIKTTIEGLEVKDLVWKPIDNIIVGMVKDPLLGKPELREGYVSCQWNKHGFPLNKNKGRDELILEVSK